MALQATIYNFDIELADNDRAVYESLPLRLAPPPSESDEARPSMVRHALHCHRGGPEQPPPREKKKNPADITHTAGATASRKVGRYACDP